MFFYHPNTISVFSEISSSPYKITALSDLLENLTDGTHYTPKYVEEGIKFISVTNITENLIDFNHTKNISEEEHNQLIKRCYPKAGDILLTKIGSVGRAAVVPLTAPCFSIFVSVALLQPKKSVDNKYLCAYLNTHFALKQFQRHLKGIGVPDLHLENIAQTQIILPDHDTQKLLSSKLEIAINQRNRKRKQANELLKALPKLLMEALEISFDSKVFQLTYSTHLTEVFGRIDADFYSPKFVHFRKQIEEGKYPSAYIGDIAEKIVTGFAAGKQNQADDMPDEERVPQLRPFNITPEGELSFETKKYVPKKNVKINDYCQKNEVIFNNTNSPDLVGKTTVFDSDVLCTASNHMTRITVKDGVNPYYVSYFFNLLLSIGYWKLLCTNFNNQAGVNIETLKSVKIPLPDIETQNAIVAKIMRRRSEANRLRKEAEQEWQEAKIQFEKELLGE